jgi:DNA-binding NtrC family response regulator/tetratricopeptide (TPR) repeat protein
VRNDDRDRIAQLEERLALAPAPAGRSAVADLEMLADLYMQADSYQPALKTIERLLALPGARSLSVARRVALESRAVSCRLAQGDAQGALAHLRELLATEDGIESPALRARLWLQCSEALFRLTRLPESREHAERGLSLADTAGDLSLAAQALNLLARAAYREGDLARARDGYEQALALYRRLGDHANSAHVRNNLGLIHKNLCEWEAAEAHLQAAYELHRESGRFAETAAPLLNLGIVHQKRGDWARALEYYARAEQVFVQVADDLRIPLVRIGCGNIARLQRRFEDAEGLLRDALERARAAGAQREQVLALEFLGELDYDRGQPEEALAHYHDALGLAQRVAPDGDLIVEIERRRAEALCAVGRLDEAERACATAMRLAGETDDRLEQAVAHRAAGSIAMARGRRAEAIEAWSRADVLLTACRDRYELGRTLLDLAQAVAEPREARRQLYRAGTLFAEVQSPYWIERTDDLLQRLMTGTGDPLPPAAGSLLGRRHRAPSLVACSAAMRRVETLARRAASTGLSVLITGETGTGKELVARTIHSLSPLAQRPFLAINCGSLRGELAPSQLFGHRKGAFTGAHAEGLGLVEAAHGGTLFLDEIGELPQDVQVTLLRFLESGEYLRLGETRVRRADVRLIAATNRELRESEGEKLFRRDLLFRLNEIEIRVPALRERPDDIVPLAHHFLAFYSGLEGPALSRDAEAVLRSYAWPGNVRELENVMKRVGALCAGNRAVDADTLLPFLDQRSGTASGVRRSADDEERAAILAAYREADGNKSRAAAILGVSRKTFYARVHRLGIPLP